MYVVTHLFMLRYMFYHTGLPWEHSLVDTASIQLSFIAPPKKPARGPSSQHFVSTS